VRHADVKRRRWKHGGAVTFAPLRTFSQELHFLLSRVANDHHSGTSTDSPGNNPGKRKYPHAGRDFQINSSNEEQVSDRYQIVKKRKALEMEIKKTPSPLKEEISS
jgi:hypothetical protein